jgi:hypothetical protein
MARTPVFSTWLAALIVSTALLAPAAATLAPWGPASLTGGAAAQTADTGAVLAHVTDDVGRPIAEVEVSVVGLGIMEHTNATGFALLDGLPTDANWTRYNVTAEKDGYRPSEMVEVVVSPWNTTEVALEVTGGIIYCVVMDSLGPVAGANVSVLTLGSNTTDAEGVCTVSGVPAGVQFVVTVSAAGYDSPQPQNVVLGDDYFEVLFFDLVPQTGAISGTVRHAATEEPLYLASVSVTVGTLTLTAYSNSLGEYRIPGVPSGTYNVTASLTGFDPASVAGVVVQNGSETSGVDLSLVEKPTKLYGIVRAGTFLVPSVLVSVVGTDLSTNTSIEGYYEISNITAGTYSLSASLEGYTPVTVLGVVIPRGGQVQVNINLTIVPGPSISGLVLSSEGDEPLSGVIVVVTGLTTQRNTITNIDGQFVVTGLTQGNYTVRFILDGYQPVELGPLVVTAEGAALDQVVMQPVPESFGGFIFGFDLAHSMMILALFLTIIILALAVMLRIRTFEAPDKAPAVYDQDEPQEEEEASEKESRRKQKKRR